MYTYVPNTHVCNIMCALESVQIVQDSILLTHTSEKVLKIRPFKRLLQNVTVYVLMNR